VNVFSAIFIASRSLEIFFVGCFPHISASIILPRLPVLYFDYKVW
jgi:preprotein translocase subunit SecY